MQILEMTESSNQLEQPTLIFLLIKVAVYVFVDLRSLSERRLCNCYNGLRISLVNLLFSVVKINCTQTQLFQLRYLEHSTDLVILECAFDQG